jgi:hypothetical protein
MTTDNRLISDQFPRASAYHPEWVLGGVSGGANPLWLTEWLAEALDLRPGMRVLDLGCGRALSSIFLRREFGVEVHFPDRRIGLWVMQKVTEHGAQKGLTRAAAISPLALLVMWLILAVAIAFTLPAPVIFRVATRG